MKTFKLVKQFESGFKLYECLKCHHLIAIPCYKKDNKKIWCYICGNTEEKKEVLYDSL